MIRLAIAAIVGPFIIGQCAPDPAPVPAPVPIPVHWIDDEINPIVFDAHPGDRVDVQFHDPYSRCDAMGGTLNIVTLVCEDVDF